MVAAEVELEDEDEVTEPPPAIDARGSRASWPRPASARSRSSNSSTSLTSQTRVTTRTRPSTRASVTPFPSWSATTPTLTFLLVVQRPAQLVAERDYKTVRDEVDDIWNQLLRYHKQKKLRPKPSLTTTFNTIHAIVREM